jgi:proteasome assembly chaperone (PAC2) family protein
MESRSVIFLERPILNAPDMVVALSGWADAAQVATGTVAYLARKLEANRFAEVNPDEFYNFPELRPTVTIENGVIASLRLPRANFFYWKAGLSGHDLILVHGVEPHHYWQRFSDLILDIADIMGVRRIYTLGGLYDRVPHTLPPRISGVVNNRELTTVLEEFGIVPIGYQGPASFHSMLLMECARLEKEAISLWGHTPFYIRMEANPMVCLALAGKLSEMLGLEVDLEELKQASEYLREMLDRLLAENKELALYVKKLEKEYLSQPAPSSERAEDAERIIKEVEDFLRQQRDRGEGMAG